MATFLEEMGIAPPMSTGVTVSPQVDPSFIRVFGLQNATPEQIAAVAAHPGAQSAFQNVDFRDDLGTPEQRFKAFQERIRTGQLAGDPKFMVTDPETGAFRGDEFLEARRASKTNAVDRFAALGTAGILAGGLLGSGLIGGGKTAGTAKAAGGKSVGIKAGAGAKTVGPVKTAGGPLSKILGSDALDRVSGLTDLFGAQEQPQGGTLNISALPPMLSIPQQDDDIFTRLLAIALASRNQNGRTPPIRGNR